MDSSYVQYYPSIVKIYINERPVQKLEFLSDTGAHSGAALSEADIDEAESAYLAGDSWAAIALRFDVDPATVGRLLRLRGVKMRPRRGRIRDPE